MIMYKNAHYLTPTDGDAFDTLFAAGSPAPHSGIYRCEGCGKETTSILGQPLPAQNHHQHTEFQGDVRWQLAVWG
jgi:hypothetical protein